MLRCRKSIVLLMKLGLYMVLMATFFLLMSIHNPQILVMSRTMAITIFTFVIIILLLTNIYGHYDIGTRKSRPIVYSLSLSVIFTDVITFIALYIMNTNDANNREFLKEDIFLLFIIMYLQVLAVIIFTYGGQAVYFSIVDPERCLIITDSLDTLDGLMRGIKKYKKQYNVVGVVEYDNHDLWERIDQVDTVFLNNVPLQQKNEIVESCYRKNKNIYYNPEIIDVVNIHSHHVLLDDVSVISAEVKELSAEQKLIKRAGDIFISLFAIIVGSPIMLGCALAIKLNDGGSVLMSGSYVGSDVKSAEELNFVTKYLGYIPGRSRAEHKLRLGDTHFSLIHQWNPRRYAVTAVDVLKPAEGAESLIEYHNGECAAVATPSSVIMGFPLEAIADPEALRIVLNRAVQRLLYKF